MPSALFRLGVKGLALPGKSYRSAHFAAEVVVKSHILLACM